MTAPRSMRLHDLLSACDMDASRVPQDICISGICDDSRSVCTGDLYLALRGAQQDGRAFISQAIERGAVAVLAEADDSVAVDSTVASVPVLAVRHLRGRVGALASSFFAQPSQAMKVLAVTGTNGKTTTSWLLASAMDQLGERAAVLGTLGVGAIDNYTPLRNTTPGAVELQSLLAGLHEAGFTAVAMEASSIGIEQQRMAGTTLRVALFTNISRDHLDYHGTMEAYAEAKAALFGWPGLAGAVLNGDDPYALRWLAAGRVQAQRVLTYGAAGHGHDIELVETGVMAQGMLLRLNVEGRAVTVTTPLVGSYNAGNLMAVIGALRVLGFALDDIVRVLATVGAPPGRMETFGGAGAAPLCVVDYAHTPDALEKILAALRTRTGGLLWCVFGCGGNRDVGKRPAMGEVAARLADRVVVTSDNPRDESAQSIIDGVLAGMPARAHVDIDIDRANAIRSAVLAAGVNDTVLIAGKGHEDYQEIAGVRQPFSDAVHVRSALDARRVRAGDVAGGAAC